MSIQDNLDTFIKNLNYKIQVDNIGLNSWGELKPRLPNKNFIRPSPKSLLQNHADEINKANARAEEINNYLEKEKQPVIINGKAYKYNQVPEPTLNDTTYLKNDLQQYEGLNDTNNKKIIVLKQKLEYERKTSQDLLNEMNMIKSDLNVLYNINDFLSFYKNLMSDTFIENNFSYDVLKNELYKIPKIKNIDEPNFRPGKNQEFKIFAKKINYIKTQLKKEYDEMKKIYDDYIANMQKIENNINKNFLKNEKIQNYISDIKNEIVKFDNENSKKINDYESQLINLNNGQFNTNQNPGESNEDYLKRLSDNAQIPYDNSTTKKLADIERNKLFIKNLKELFDNNQYIEKILNYYRTSPNEDYISIFNKYFNLFKKDYLEIYGFNNKQITDNINDFIVMIENFCQAKDIAGNPKLETPLNTITNQKNEIVKLSSFDNSLSFNEETKSDHEYNNTNQIMDDTNDNQIMDNDNTVYDKIFSLQTSLQDNDTTLKIINGDGDIIYFKYIDKPLKKYADQNLNIVSTSKVALSNKGPPILFFSDSGDEGSFFEARYTIKSKYSFYKILKKFFKLTDSEMKKYFKMNTTKIKPLNVFDIKNIWHLKPTPYDEKIPPILRLENMGNSKRNPLLGMGIKTNNEIPELIHFGKYYILLKKLITKNILSLQKSNRQKVPGFQNKHISDAFIDIIIKILSSQKIAMDDLESLKSGEKELLDKLLHACELNKFVKTGSGVDTLNKAKEQLALIEGQIQAGNNNPILKKELYDALFKLVHFGAISERQARSHYKTIVQDFFN